jgi:hypothetical protein
LHRKCTRRGKPPPRYVDFNRDRARKTEVGHGWFNSISNLPPYGSPDDFSGSYVPNYRQEVDSILTAFIEMTNVNGAEEN